MKYEFSGLSTGQVVLVASLVFIAFVFAYLGIVTLALMAWNAIAGAAGWSASIPVTPTTVICGAFICWFAKSVFSRKGKE
ncbi:hypothetical protein HQN64_20350 [Enterobacteriaceae bacterium BIT-l23]|uniref:hypothetical protein n=1 Tax=Jejubacter sp. L23 TaxID=3092086 RepID=UPI001584F4D4|nr:hypothetical protein [Enterobacteriaceae bacterium BIT-l23]